MEEVPQDLGAAAIRGVRWTYLARGTIEIVLLGSMVVLARLIPPEEYGRFAIAAIVGELGILVPSEGVGTALVQRKTVTHEHLQAGFALALLSAAFFTVLTLIAAVVLIDPIFGERTADLVRLSTPGFFVAAMSAVPMAILRRRLDFSRLSIIDIVSTLVRVAGSVGLAIAGLEAESLVIGGLVSGVVASAIAWSFAPAPLPWLRRSAARDILGYGLPASIASMSWVGFRNCDYALVAARLGAGPAGLYFRAYQLGVEYQKKLSQVMGQVGFPVLARAKDVAEMSRLRSQMVRLLTIMMFPILVLLAILAPVVVPLAYGDAWSGAVVPTQILALGGAATLVIDAVGAALAASGRARAILGYGVGHFALYATAVYFVAPYGLAAVAVSAAVVHTVFLYVAYATLLHGTSEPPLRSLWHDIAPALVSSVALGATATPTSLVLSGTPALVQMAAVGAVGLVTYAIALRLAFPASWQTVMRVVGRLLPQRRLFGFGPRLAADLGAGQ